MYKNRQKNKIGFSCLQFLAPHVLRSGIVLLAALREGYSLPNPPDVTNQTISKNSASGMPDGQQTALNGLDNPKANSTVGQQKVVAANAAIAQTADQKSASPDRTKPTGSLGAMPQASVAPSHTGEQNTPAAGSLAELNQTQKDVLVLKAQLEREKLQKELTSLKRADEPSQSTKNFTKPLMIETASDAVGGSALQKFSDLRLLAIHGTPGKLKANVQYKTGPVLEIKEQDILPSGETIIELAVDHLTFEFQGQRKRIVL